MLEFLILHVIVFFHFRLVLKNILWHRNALLILAINVIFCWWDWRSLLLVMLITLESNCILYRIFKSINIALGTGKLFGVELLANFKFSNLLRNVAEYWQYWYIYLSTRFRRYLHILLKNRGGKFVSIRNIILIFVVSRFSYGANWLISFKGNLHAPLNHPLLLIELRKNWFKNDSLRAKTSYSWTY